MAIPDVRSGSGVKGLLNRVPECLPSRLNWVSPPPTPQSCVAPPRTQVGGATLSRRRGGTNADDWTDTLVLNIVITLRAQVKESEVVHYTIPAPND